MKIFDGASFPFWHEVGRYLEDKKFVIEEIDLNFMTAAEASTSAKIISNKNMLAF